MTKNLDIAIIGAGLAGASAAYHLANLGLDIIIYEAGKPGRGNDHMISGTLGPNFPDHSKMVLTWPEPTVKDIIRKCGEQAAIDYFNMSSKGVELQKEIANSFNKNLIRELGTFIVEDKNEWNFLKQDIELYKKLGFKCEEKSKKDINKHFQTERFVGGFYFLKDAIINQQAYINNLTNHKKIYVNSNSYVQKLEEKDDKILIHVQDQEKPEIADYVILATNGFNKLAHLNGLEPYWALIACFKDPGINTPNFFNLTNEYYDFTRQDNILQIGGVDTPADNFREPKDYEILRKKLLNWSYETFPYLEGKNPDCEHFGVYARTSDGFPIVGKDPEKNRIIHVVGCNSVGQSTLTYAASLIPAILNLADFKTKDDEKIAKFLSPNRLKN